MTLHTPTLFVLLIVASFALSATIAAAAYRRQQGLFWWSGALALQGVAFLLFGLRGQIHDALSIVGANVALSSAFALFGEGIYRFQVRTAPRWLLWAPVVVIGAAFSLLLDDIAARLVISGPVIALQCLLMFRPLLQRWRDTPGRGKYILGAGILAVLGALLLRMLQLAMGTFHIEAFTDSAPMQAYTFVVSLVALIWFSFGLMMMSQDRAEKALQAEQQHEAFHNDILELLASGEPLRKILAAIVTGIEVLHPGMLCSVLLLDRKGERLGEGIAPSLPDYYNAAVEGLSIGMGAGSCGTAAFLRQRVVVEDISTHPYWAPFKALAARAGLGACWSQPILSASHGVLGTFAIYHRQPHSPTAARIALIEESARLASLAIERSRAASALSRSEAHYRLVVEAASEGICVVRDGAIHFVNPRLVELLGYNTEADLLGRTFVELIQQEDQLLAMHNDQELLGAFDSLRYPLRLVTRSQGARWFELSTTRFEREGQVDTLNVLTDITDRKLSEERFRQLAYLDTLTQLPNRRRVMEHIRWVLADAQATGRYGALMFLDLDNFKPLNDTHGHSVGDLLLRAVAGRLEACVREADFVGRFGGDEFVVVLGDLGLDEQGAVAAARALAQQILGSVSARYDLSVPSEGDEPLPVQHRCSVSIGLVLFPAAGMTEQGLLRQADAAMYQAKQAGRNTVRLAAAV